MNPGRSVARRFFTQRAKETAWHITALVGYHGMVVVVVDLVVRCNFGIASQPASQPKTALLSPAICTCTYTWASLLIFFSLFPLRASREKFRCGERTCDPRNQMQWNR